MRLPQPTRPLSLPEFTVLLAVMYATVAFSIDAMLPALPQIAADLTPEAVNRAQLVLTSFVLGMGAGTLFAGPISDAIGRKPAISLGLLLYMLAALAAAAAPSLEWLLAARFVQGLGAAAPRVVNMAVVRDRFEGREMARVTSFIMMVFILVPAIAPTIGAGIIALVGWHGVFLSFVVFGVVNLMWLNLRLPETLNPADRRPLRAGPLAAAARTVLGDRDVRRYTLVMTLGFAQMFALLSSSQQIYAGAFGITDTFPYWFAAMALLSGTGTVLNARFVMRLGMRRIVTAAYAMQVVVAALYLAALLLGGLPPAVHFAAFFVWSVTLFFMAGVTFGNLNALAMQKMGHVAGMAASVISALSTVGSVMIAAPVGLMFDGTETWVVAAAVLCSAAALWLMRGSAAET